MNSPGNVYFRMLNRVGYNVSRVKLRSMKTIAGQFPIRITEARYLNEASGFGKDQ